MGERVFIVIDGNNFYHRLKELKLTNLLDFDYEKLSQFLLGVRKAVMKKYYIGAVRERHSDLTSKKLRRNQRILTQKLWRTGWRVAFGELLETEGKYHEKGVDVQIAVDLLVGAYENLYDTAILVSSDTDLIPALAKARSMKKKIEYIGFSHKPSYGLITHSDIRRLLTKDEVEQFF